MTSTGALKNHESCTFAPLLLRGVSGAQARASYSTWAFISRFSKRFPIRDGAGAAPRRYPLIGSRSASLWLSVLALVIGCATAIETGVPGGAETTTGGGSGSAQGETLGSNGAVQGGSLGNPSSAGMTASPLGGTTQAGGQGSSVPGAGGAVLGDGGSGDSALDFPGGAPTSGGSSGVGSVMGGSAGTSGAGGSGGGAGGGAATGTCAPTGGGWVVQYWTDSAAANPPTGKVRIFNNSAGTVNLNTLQLRHYFTNEETATLMVSITSFGHSFPSDPYYQDEGTSNVLPSIVEVTPARPNASQYIRIQFNDKPGNFGNDEYVELEYFGTPAKYPSKSNQANDYTYMNRPAKDPGSADRNGGWDHITLYAKGELVWGCEP